MTDHSPLLDSYLAGAEELRAAVAGMSREQLASRPIPGKWSTLEVVCHLADTDANIVQRIKRVLAEDRPSFDRVRPDRMQAALAYHARDAEEEVAIIDLGRRQVARILRASPEEVWVRVGIVGDRGERTIVQMLNGAIDHVRHHLKFIVEKRQALGLEETL